MKLRHTMEVDRVPVVSRHHQALDQICAPWAVCAVDEAGLIEAIELAGHEFAIGVQWHPEASDSASPHGRLFTALVEASSRYAAARPASMNRHADSLAETLPS